tara:strand:- start:413 stop:631 length:219 start_codon:yes stop_codon:yes gene_type:complete
MDSYNSQPIINEADLPYCINIGDTISKDDWLNILSGTDPQIPLNVKAEDVRHLFWDSEDIMHSVSIKVVTAD